MFFCFKFKKLDEKWENFVKSELENINTIQNKDLGGHNPKKPNQVEEDENYKIEIDIKKIYEVKINMRLKKILKLIYEYF